jgi:hypothetical protein
MAELLKEELVKIAHVNQHLVGIAKQLALSSSVADKVDSSQVLAQVEAMLDAVRNISTAVSTAR